MSLNTGDNIGPYQIAELLGKGGMGEVFKARDTRLNRAVAIKFLFEELADAAARRRFQREAQTASSLNHPHIVAVYDVGEADGRQYIVTEYIDGGTLRDWARQEKRDWRQIVELLTGVADGLAAAHQAKILHRDIKPGNILITKSGYAKLADFGLAKLEEEAVGQDDETVTLTERPTKPGVMIGTIPYMSPEQASGLKLDARGDIFSFGIVLYELLAGRRPFSGKTDLEVMQKVIHAEPQPLGEEIPAALRVAVEKALEKDPAERYQSMREMVVDLRRIARQGAENAPASPRLRLAWVVLLPLLLLLGFAFLQWRAPRSTEPLRAVPLTTLAGVEWYPSISPDGNHVAFTWNGPRRDNPDVYVQQIGAGSPLRLTTDAANDYNPVWSPDGRWIAFLRGEPLGQSGIVVNGELRLIAPLGGPERKLTEIQVRQTVSEPGFLAWCPDSDCLVVTDSPGEGRPDALFVVSLETGDKRQLTSLQPPGYGDTNPAVSPDGNSLVFRRNVAFAAGELYWLPLGKGLTPNGEPRRLTPATLDAAYPAWMPDGNEILFSARGNLWRLAVGKAGASESQPERLPFVGEDGSMSAVSRAQPGRLPRLVYARSFSDLNIWRIETSGVVSDGAASQPGGPSSSAPNIAISSTRSDHQPHFSPDGNRVAFQSNRSGEGEIWVADPDGSAAVQLTSMGASVTAHVGWSPDGESIVFDSNREGQFEIYVVPVAGGRPRRLTSDPASDHYPSFSRDGQWIYFASNRTGEYQVWRVPASGGDAVQFTKRGGWVAVESVDGAYVYYTETTGTVPTSLWRLPASGGEPVKILEGVVQRAFAVLEKGIYYIDQLSGETRLQFLDFATGNSRTVARNLGDVTSGLAASPDGRIILYTRQDSSVDDLMMVENFR